ncbi:MAG: hypothetical protein ACLTAF_02545 [Blautia coccoides]
MVKHYREKLWSITGYEEIPPGREFDAKNYELTEEESFRCACRRQRNSGCEIVYRIYCTGKQTVEVLGDGNLVVNWLTQSCLFFWK